MFALEPQTSRTAVCRAGVHGHTPGLRSNERKVPEVCRLSLGQLFQRYTILLHKRRDFQLFQHNFRRYNQ